MTLHCLFFSTVVNKKIISRSKGGDWQTKLWLFSASFLGIHISIFIIFPLFANVGKWRAPFLSFFPPYTSGTGGGGAKKHIL